MALSDHQTLVESLVRDDAQHISSDDRDRAIARAVADYSRHRPRTLVADLVGADSHLLDGPADWDLSAASLVSAEYPIGNNPPTEVDIGVYQSTDTVQLALEFDLASTESLRLTFDAAHVVDDTDDTVPDRDLLAVAQYAASLLCDQLSNYYASQTGSNFDVEVRDQSSPSQQFAARSRRYMAGYRDHLDLPKDGPAPQPANAVADWGRRPSQGARMYRRFR